MSPRPPRPLFEVALTGEVAHVRFADAALDERNAEAMREQMPGLLGRLAGCHVFVDLGNVVFITSSWLGLFVTLFRELRASGGRLTLHNVTPEVFEEFTATRLTAILEVREQDRPEAPSELSQPV